MKILLFILFFALPAEAQWSVDQNLRSYAEDFIGDSHGMLRDGDLDHVHFKFEKLGYDVKLGSGIIGMCYRTIFSDNFTIGIDPDYWNNAYTWEDDRWQLMYHELGHCMCNLEHPIDSEPLKFIEFLGRYGIKHNRYKMFFDGCPMTLMHPINVEHYCLNNHREYYVKEIFKHCRVLRTSDFSTD